MNWIEYGFVRIAAAVPKIKVAEVDFNTGQILKLIQKAQRRKAQLIVFPELVLTGYTCNDLFHQSILQEEVRKNLKKILEKTKNYPILIVLGLPWLVGSKLFNCAAILHRGKILGLVPKMYIPGYKEFYEKRWFISGKEATDNKVWFENEEIPFGYDLLFAAQDQSGFVLGVEICEDLWVPIPPSSYQSVAGATILVNLSASNEIIGKRTYRRDLVKQQSARCLAGYVYTSAGWGESTTDVVFGGEILIAENGQILAEKRFQRKNTLLISEIDVEKLISERRKITSFSDSILNLRYHFRKIYFRFAKAKLPQLTRKINPYPFVPKQKRILREVCREIILIQTTALAKRLEYTNLEKVVIGLSGGLDSALALLVAVKTFEQIKIPRQNILALLLPGFGTTTQTFKNAQNLCRALKVSWQEIDIRPACQQHFNDLNHPPEIHNLVFENSQARERTQILMDKANQIQGLVIGTGNLSELALGWCTYNGDQMSMYSINAGIPKTLIRALVEYIAENQERQVQKVLLDILQTPISPELLPNGLKNQKTEKIIGPYELHDFFLYYFLRFGFRPKKILYLAQTAFRKKYSLMEIKKWLKVFLQRFFANQFKRSVLPDGPKVGTVALSPRGDWRMPSDAEVRIWLKDLE